MLGRRRPLLFSSLRSLLSRGFLAARRLLHAVPAAVVIFFPARTRVFVNIAVVTRVHVPASSLACGGSAIRSRRAGSFPARGSLHRSGGSLCGRVVLCICGFSSL